MNDESFFERMDVLGTLEPEQLPKWEELGIAEYRQKQCQIEEKEAR